MAEFGYGYHTEFDEPTPLAYEDLGIPEFSKPGAKPTRADADVANLLSKLPLKDGTIDFNIDLGTNTGSDISKAIDPTKQVPGADPDNRLPDDKLCASLYSKGALPKLQSFKAAIHSNKKYLLIVGGRIAGLHPFGTPGFQQIKQNYALFVVDLEQYVMAGAALPNQYFENMGLMNGQATQVKKSGKNYLFVAGGYGYSTTGKPDMKTFNTLTVLDVDGVVDSIMTAASASQPTVPNLGSYIWQTEHEDLQVTGGEMMFNPASNEPTGEDHLYLVVGQTFKGSYAGKDIYTYIRGMRKFAVPYPSGGTLPPVIITEIAASKDTTTAHDPDAMSAQLARRDLNIVPTFLPGTFKDSTAYPGVTILSGVFNQDGSDAPYLQPLVINFNKELKTRSSTPSSIPIYTSRPFFQLFNNYNCCNVQLFSIKQGVIYNVLCGGVSYFYKTQGDPTGCGLDQVNSLFKAPFTTDISIVKQDNSGNFTQRLVPPSTTFLKENKLSMFGTESLFIPNPAIPLTKALPESSGVLDLDWIIAQNQSRYKLGTMYGGIENIPSAYPPPYPPSFQPAQTDATSRMVDVYITF